MPLSSILKQRKWEIAAFFLPILIRLIYLIELSAHPGFESLMVDEKWHWLWAHDILNGSFWGEGSYFRGPLYPYVLAALVWITDSSVFWTKALQLLICGGIGLLLFKLTERLFDRKSAGLAAIMYACYGTFLFYDTMLLVEILFLFFALWALYRLVVVGRDAKPISYLLVGLLFGLSALARPNILLVMPFLALWLALRRDKTRKWRLRFASPLTLALGTILAIAPVTLRNYLVTGDFILISSQGGVNFYIGNNPDANGLNMLMPEVALTESVPWDKFVPVTHQQAEKEAGRTLSEAEASDYWNRKAWNYIADNPGEFLSLTLKKIRYLFSGFENSDNGDIYYQRTQSIAYAILLWSFMIFFPFGLLFPLTVAGMYLSKERCSLLSPVYVTILAYIPSIILFLVTARHRLLLVLLFIPFAAYAIVWFGRWFIGKVKGNFLVPVLLFALVLLLCNIPYGERGPMVDFQIHYNEALRLQAAGAYDKAEQEYVRAATYYPGSSTLYNNLGYIQYLQGKSQSAETNIRRSIALDPQFYQPYNNLGLLFEQKNQFDSAAAMYTRSIDLVDRQIETPEQVAQLYLNLGKSLQAQNQPDAMQAAFRGAIEAASNSARTLTAVAISFAGIKQFALSDSLFRTARELEPLTAPELLNWGMTYLERRDFFAGIEQLRKSYELDSTIDRTAFNLSVALHESGAGRDTVMHYLNRALKLNPSYPAALKFQAYLRTQ